MKDIMNENKHYAYLLSLLFSVISSTEPTAVPEWVDFNTLYELGKKHDVTNIAYYAIEKLNADIDPALKKKWEGDRNRNFHRNMIQTAEFSALCSAFEQEGVEYMPLKGLAVSELYPSPDCRFMSDLDILVKDARKAGEVAEKLGYTADRVDAFYDDSYRKPPFMHLELHRDLFSIDSSFHDYFQNFFDRAVNTRSSRWDMTPEDFYIYIIAHLYKHYCDSGTGIRSVSDIYLLNKNFLPKLDREKFYAELDVLGIRMFFDEFSAVADKWFGRGDFDEFSAEELYILGSGTYGRTENLVKNRYNQLGEKHYFIKRIFPPLSFMQDIFCPLRKYPVLLPFFYVYRIVRLVSPKYRKKIEYELKVINQKKK